MNIGVFSGSATASQQQLIIMPPVLSNTLVPNSANQTVVPQPRQQLLPSQTVVLNASRMNTPRIQMSGILPQNMLASVKVEETSPQQYQMLTPQQTTAQLPQIISQPLLQQNNTLLQQQQFISTVSQNTVKRDRHKSGGNTVANLLRDKRGHVQQELPKSVPPTDPTLVSQLLRSKRDKPSAARSISLQGSPVGFSGVPDSASIPLRQQISACQLTGLIEDKASMDLSARIAHEQQVGGSRSRQRHKSASALVTYRQQAKRNATSATPLNSSAIAETLNQPNIGKSVTQ